MTEAICTSCLKPFVPIPSEKGLCRECRRIKGLAWREKRRQEGRPYKSPKVSREWKRTWETEYRKRPGVMEARRARANARILTEEEKAKASARSILRGAVRRGKVARQPCEVCGDPKAHGHHDDYSKPLDVRWLCHAHHMEHHYGQAEVVAALRKAADLQCKAEADAVPRSGGMKTNDR